MQQSAAPATRPSGTGDMARRVREYDWAETPLGPITAWSPSLRAAVDICLGSAVASFLWWGPDLIQFHNDAALEINGAKHPMFLGKPARDAWADVWEEVGGLLNHVVATGESVRGDNLPIVSDRDGSPETVWFAFSCGPARDETGAVAGVFCSAIETTADVRAQQAQQALRASEARQTYLLRLIDSLRPLADPVAIQEVASRLLGDQLGADRVMYGEAVDNDVLVIHRAYRRDEAMPSPVGRHRFDDYGEYVAREFRAGRALMVSDVLQEPQHTERDLGQYAAVGIRAYIAVPLVKDRRIVAYLAVNQATPRAWTEADLELIRETAERTWAAVEQARAEQSLRRSEERYRTLFQSMDQGFCIIEKVESEAGQPSDFRYLVANPAFARHTGMEDVTGKTIRELIPDAEERIMAHYDAVVQTGQSIHFQDHVAAIDLWMEAEAYPGQSPGQVAVLFTNSGNRKRAEAALRASEERYRTLFESIDQGFCTIEVLFDPAGQAVDYIVLETNPAFVRNTGLVDAVGKRMRELAPAHEDHWFETYGRVALTGISARFEEEAAALGRWYSVYAYRIGEPDQHRVAVLFEDITARKAAEAAVRASEERFQTLVQNIGDYAIFMLDADGLVTEWPAGAQRVKGYTPEEVIGQHVSLFYPPEELATGDPARELAEAAKNGRAEREAWRLRKGGERFWGNEIATAIRDDAGQLIGFTKITRDLTERRQAEEALHDREERYRLIVDEATNYAILSTDAEDRIETWSPGATAVFGWTATEAVGQRFDFIFTPEDRATGVPEQERAQARADGRAPDVRWHLRRNGSRVFIEGSAYALKGPDQEFRGLFKIGQDVTARRLAGQRQQEDEEQIRQELVWRVAEATTELRLLSRRLLQVQEEERRHLALELHDDFGQMLTGLGLTLGTGELDAARLAEAQQIVAELTERIRERSMELRPATLDSFGLLTALRWHLERYQRQTGIAVELLQEGLDQRFSPTVEITAYRIVQEALTNVARHSGSKLARIQLFADDVALTLSVRDHGRGFGAESKNGGSGMAGMRERTELLGGTLEIDTGAGEGVTLIVELPLKVPTVAEASREEV